MSDAILKKIKDEDVAVRRPALHRHAREDAACDLRPLDGRQGSLRRRHDVRRLIDRRLEGDQRVRHAADAGSRVCAHRSVLPAEDAGDHVRHPQPERQHAVQPRPAHDGEKGGDVPEVRRHRRHRVLRPRSRVLRVLGRAVVTPTRTTPATRSTIRNCRPTRAAPTKAATWATARGPRAATSPSRRSTACRTCAPRCSRSCTNSASTRKNTTTKWRRRSTNSA